MKRGTCRACPRRGRAVLEAGQLGDGGLVVEQPGRGHGLPHLGSQPLKQRLGRAPDLGLEHDLAGLGLVPDPAVEDRSRFKKGLI